MAAVPIHQVRSQVIQNSCFFIINSVRSSPLNFSIQETPFSIYLTVRKSIAKSAYQEEYFPKSTTEEPKYEKAANALKEHLEEAIDECETKSKVIGELNKQVENLVSKLEESKQEKINIKALYAKEIEVLETRLSQTHEENQSLMLEKNTLKESLENSFAELDHTKLEVKETALKSEMKISDLKLQLKAQENSFKDISEKIKEEKDKSKALGDINKNIVLTTEASAQTGPFGILTSPLSTPLATKSQKSTSNIPQSICSSPYISSTRVTEEAFSGEDNTSLENSKAESQTLPINSPAASSAEKSSSIGISLNRKVNCDKCDKKCVDLKDMENHTLLWHTELFKPRNQVQNEIMMKFNGLIK